MRRKREWEISLGLDEWLSALHRGLIKMRPKFEAFGGVLISRAGGNAEGFRDRAVARRNRWPRLCRTCGAEFSGHAGRVRCPNCCRKQEVAK
jgi:hypothetical protein